MLIIRMETRDDYEKVYQVVKRAFESAEHSDGNEQDLVVALRKSDAFVPELSLVAELDGDVVGHIMFTVNQIGGHTALTLAPLSVLPRCQRQGVGTALIKAGHQLARGLGYQCCVVIGSDKYYPRLGYIPASTLGIRAAFDIPEENFMAIDLKGDSAPIIGVVKYPKEFGI